MLMMQQLIKKRRKKMILCDELTKQIDIPSLIEQSEEMRKGKVSKTKET